MAINDDFQNKAEAEMKLNDAKMIEQAMLRKLSSAPLSERIKYALGRNKNDLTATLHYMQENHMIKEGERVTEEDIRLVMS